MLVYYIENLKTGQITELLETELDAIGNRFEAQDPTQYQLHIIEQHSPEQTMFILKHSARIRYW
jgi:hypothetical protein